MSGAIVAAVAGVNSLTGGKITNALGFGGGGTSTSSQGGGAQMADPFAPYRTQYATQLNSLMQNPSSVTSLPGYQFNLQAGQDQILASDAASGRTGSGGEKMALARYGTDYASSFFNNYASMLAQYSGASWGASAGSNAGSLANAQYGQGQANAMGGLGALATGLKGIYNNFGPGTQQAPAPVVDANPVPVNIPSGYDPGVMLAA